MWSFWALRVPAPEKPGLVARGVSPWKANGRAAKPQRGDREPEVGTTRDWPGTAAWVWCIGRRRPFDACSRLSPLRGFVVRGCRCPGACAPGYRPSPLRGECSIPHRAASGTPSIQKRRAWECRRLDRHCYSQFSASVVQYRIVTLRSLLSPPVARRYGAEGSTSGGPNIAWSKRTMALLRSSTIK